MRVSGLQPIHSSSTSSKAGSSASRNKALAPLSTEREQMHLATVQLHTFKTRAATRMRGAHAMQLYLLTERRPRRSTDPRSHQFRNVSNTWPHLHVETHVPMSLYTDHFSYDRAPRLTATGSLGFMFISRAAASSWPTLAWWRATAVSIGRPVPVLTGQPRCALHAHMQRRDFASQSTDHRQPDRTRPPTHPHNTRAPQKKATPGNTPPRPRFPDRSANKPVDITSFANLAI